MQDSSLINRLISISIIAGEILMKHREAGFDVEVKGDESPVTAADREADEYISAELAKISPLPVVSEEGRKDSLPSGSSFWLVDPLDGTKSFIRGESEFTVNIGLIEGSKPKYGVIYQPVKDKLWYVADDMKACFLGDASTYFDEDSEETSLVAAENIKVSGKSIDEELIVVASKSHLSEETKKHLENISVKSFTGAASSLKFCLVADGSADYYPRFSPTMQWDTAAGHAILNAAGGSVVNPDGSSFTYEINPEDIESLRNGSFIANGW